MKYKVTVAVEMIYRGEVEANSKEEAFDKVYDELGYRSFDEFLDLRDEHINVYLDTF